MHEVEIDKSIYLECYHHLLDDSDIDIELIWGSRDSGKSKFVAQNLTEVSMDLNYFRCLLIKQTHESIKDAQWQMLKDVSEDWGVDHLFNFQISPLGAKVRNGNTFVARGMDNPGKIRSFTNPSHAWVEEGNQISLESFITLLTSLRSDFGRVKLYFTFNPEADCPDFTEFWLYKMFFAKYEHLMYNHTFTGEMVMEVFIKGEKKTIRLKYRSTWTTYHDNPFITDQRIAFLESLATEDPHFHEVFAKGRWGNASNPMPWAFAFNRGRHIGYPVPTTNEILYLSFDFNRNPAACLAIQWYDNKIRVLESIKIPKSGTDALCDYILFWYPGYLPMVTGDYSGNTASSIFEEEVTNYLVIKNKLNLSDGQIQIAPNPKLAKNQTLVNNILKYYPVEIHKDKAKGLIFDMENVKKRADGTIVKDDRDDPAQQSDLLDCFRYFCNKFLGNFKPPPPELKSQDRNPGRFV